MVRSQHLPAVSINPTTFNPSSRRFTNVNRASRHSISIPTTSNTGRILRLSHVRRQARSIAQQPDFNLEESHTSTEGGPSLPIEIRSGASGSTVQETSLPNDVPLQRRRRRTVQNCARDFMDNNTLHIDVLPEGNFCAYCGAKLFKYEKMELCCASGKIRLPYVPVPAELLHIYADQGPEGLNFRKNIRILNHLFAFTSMGVQIDENLANAQHGIYTFRAHGSIYHKVGSLLPQQGCRPRYLQLYIYDTEHEMDHRMLENNSVDILLVEKIQHILNRHNPFVHIFRQLGMRQDLPDCRLLIKELRPAQHQYTMPNASQVAAIIIGVDNLSECARRDIIVQTHGDMLENVPDTTGYYDPLQYPLLLPYGSYGWDVNTSTYNGQNISCRAFYAHKLQIRNGYESLLLRGGRLLQQYVVDNWVKIETQKLRYIRDNQNTIRAELYQGLQDSLQAGETIAGNVGRRIILPSSYIGSPRDKYHRYQDAMALVQRYGKPDLFITMTCNPTWDEITRDLLPGQTAQDRPDLTTRIFRAKCEELKKDVLDRKVLGVVIAHVHVIEFQKRGLPHVYMLIIMAETDKLNNLDLYDGVVRAEIPDANIEPSLHVAVSRHMLHGPCGQLNSRCSCMRDGKCSKGYPRQFSHSTMQGNDSYPIYRRRDNGFFVTRNSYQLDNRWVVPYNPWLLKKYNCHLNVEICSSIKSVKYLYKYIHKGPDRVTMAVRPRINSYNDGIMQFVDARWVCPQEAMWRIFKFPTSKIYPSVYAMQIHLPNRQQVTYYSHQPIEAVLSDENLSRTMLTEFFHKNSTDAEAQSSLYREFPEKYRWMQGQKCWRRRCTTQRVVGRIYTVSPVEGERYYLRILLNHVRGPTSFDDLLTVHGNICSSFKQAAEQMGLLESDHSIRDCLQEASSVHMPTALRRLFATILVYCEPTGVRQLWDEFYPYLTEDFGSSSRGNTASVTNRLLSEINDVLRQYAKSVFEYDLPAFHDDGQEGMTNQRMIYEEEAISVSEEDLVAVSALNRGQRYAFDKIIDAVHQANASVFFIDGPGGTGKTFLYRAVLATLRKEHKICLATATSGIAAMILPGGRTAHSRFKIPIRLTSASFCTISKQSELAELLRRASAIIWDEATMTHRHAFEALDRTLRDLIGVDHPFGGKIVILGGDLRQVLPVVPRGTRSETVNACIIRSQIWADVQIIHLTENMRAVTDPQFSEFLLRIGEGLEPTLDDNFVRIPEDMVIPWSDNEEMSALIASIFPSLTSNAQDRAYMTERAVLAPTNECVERFNEAVISVFPGEEIVYHSYDTVEDDTQNLYQQEFLNSIAPGGLPPHKLRLKLGSPIILLRNIDPKIGLCNGARMLCRGFQRNLIDAEIVTGHFIGTRVFLPRIPLRTSENIQLPFTLIRKQFPVRLSFALTINKAQGQTIPHVGVYLSANVFSHGQLYVALSRGVSKNSTKVMVKKGKIERQIGTYTRNVVYKEVLLNHMEGH